ncbi:transcriptional regulator [Paramagnetospirillum marisnigri]|uniref:Transcriptional regulator n=1 Tax=Paramagnetospirillum marisnigri TaxID=1285242 RepID=A0A178M7P1_9PROT|nr:SIR2 family protein [Paramagnetospirillum marisnigri]OAN44779.1 transcriptional regulator [Paramagnetospirillum marisnigri]
MLDSPTSLLAGIGGEIAAGNLIPFLGPDVLLVDGASPVPSGARELSLLMASKVGVPGRIKQNLWHAAQYIETHKHRVTVDRMMADIFKTVPEPNALHRWLAGLPKLPLIVDTWYDGAMREALNAAGRTDWGIIQGASKARRIDGGVWTRAVTPDGAIVADDQADNWGTVLYKPHGAAQPTGDVLVSDSDYVEVLTDIDIQTPIPEAVKTRRAGRGFVFLGCRFYDQILRTFARQICKRSGGPRYAVVPEDLTRNEYKFLELEGIKPVTMPLSEAVATLTAAN